MSSTFGSRTMARPMATRWRWPPESALGLRSRYSVMSSIAAAFSTRLSISSWGILRNLSGNSMLPRTVMCGYRA